MPLSPHAEDIAYDVQNAKTESERKRLTELVREEYQLQEISRDEMYHLFHKLNAQPR